jgi:DNA-binding winged helix-turn-helix (wHTH) protein
VSDLETRGGESATHGRFGLGGLTVEPRDGTISGPAARVRVDPQVMAVLVLLFRSASEVVPREALFEQVWPGRVVGDDALTRCIYQLRQRMAEAGGSDEYRSLIETLPKRGYRLHVEKPAANHPPPQRGSSFSRRVFASLILAIAALLIGAAIRIAERPGAAGSSAASVRAAEAVASASGYFGRADRRTALPIAVALYQEAARLDPAYVPAWAGLARAHTDMYWHGIDRSPARLARAEEAVDRLVALDSQAPESHLARAHYLFKGPYLVEEALQALEIAERSIPDDPELSLMRAMIHRRLGNWASAVEALDEAISRDPSNVVYLRQQFLNYQFLRDYGRADRMLDRILALRPDDGTSYVDRVGLALCRNGDTSIFHAYRESVPSPYYDEGVAFVYTSWLAAIFARDFESALKILDGTNENPIFDGDFRNASFGPKELFYARTHRLAGNHAAARDAYAAVIRLVEEPSLDRGEADAVALASRYLALAEAQAGLGQREAALDSLGRALALVPATLDAVTGPALALNSVTRVLAPAGYDDEALRALDHYLGDAGHWSIEGLKKDPRLQELARTPGFKALEKRYARLQVANESLALVRRDPGD